ncbi:MAG TPA: T9SS type A sorting domain-containing protein, partial [Bacteroidales bacterium]|nr:T9SS type A sorting domain-containing protein [Bacteroidales bacterium]
TNLTFLWTFPGGTPSSSTLPNPQITYSLPGVYDVKLKVSNGYWSDSLTRSGYMHVHDQPAAPVILANGYILTSNYPQGNQWYRDGSPMAGANSQQYEAMQSGTYWDRVTLDGCESDTSNHIYLIMAGLGSLQTPNLQLSPVPSTGTFTLSFFYFPEENCRLTVTDHLGKGVYLEDFKSAPGRNNKTVILPQLSNGIYFVTLTMDAGPVTRKMIITLN